MRLSEEALTKIHGAFESVKGWAGGPDESVLDAIRSGLLAAHDLTTPEGTSSPNAKPRRDRLHQRHIMTKVFGVVSMAELEVSNFNPVTVARVTALLGGMVTTVLREDFVVGRKRQRSNIKGGENSAGDDAEVVDEIHGGWVEHAKKRVQESPKVNGKVLAEEIFSDQGLNPMMEPSPRYPDGKRRAFGTINNYLSKHRAEWDPDHQ